VSDLSDNIIRSDGIRVMDGDEAPRDHDPDTVRQRHHLFEIRGHDKHGGPAFSLLPKNGVDFSLRAHIDADGRFIED
jgi:hypothetical protein